MKKTFLIVLTFAVAMCAQVKLSKFITIGADTSSTRQIDLGNYGISAIGVPSTWTTANIYVLASDSSNGEFQYVKSEAGDTLIIPVWAGTVTTIKPVNFFQFRWIKLLSESTGGLVAQAAGADIELYLVNILKP